MSFRNFLNESLSKYTPEQMEIFLHWIDSISKLKDDTGKVDLVWKTTNGFKYSIKNGKDTIETLINGNPQGNLSGLKCPFTPTLKKEGKYHDGSWDYIWTFGSKSIKLISSGGRTGGNTGKSKGHDFEDELQNDIIDYLNGNQNVRYADTIHKIENIIKSKHGQNVTIINSQKDGGKNQKRKVNLTANGVVYDKKSIGDIVTDITLTLSNGKKEFLSLKVGDAKFGNFGINYLWSEKEFKSGLIENPAGRKFLEGMGFDNAMFAECFASLIEKRPRTMTIKKEYPFRGDRKYVADLIKAQIGYGYIFVKKLDNVKCLVIDYSNRASLEAEVNSLQNMVVVYPAQGAKTASLKLETTNFKMTFVIRERNGNLTYPKSMDLNYRQKH